MSTDTVLPGSIAETLRASILSQVDAPGTALTEASVAARFGVARPTARIAIDRLVADGLLRREAHRAARIPELTRDDIVDLYDSRRVIEGAAIENLAAHGSVPAAAVAAHRSLLAGDDDFAADDIEFHRALVAGQPSPRLARMHAALLGEVELCIGQVQAAHLITATEVGAQHQAILDAVIAGDAGSAARLLHDHITGSRDRLLAHYDDTH